MSLSYIENGIERNHIRNAPLGSIYCMGKVSVAEVLWANVSALMLHHWKEENINRLAREAKIGPATVQRMKDQETTIRLDTIEKVAGVFGLRSWQLLIPGLDPANVPIIMVSEDEKRLYAKFHKMKLLLEEKQ